MKKKFFAFILAVMMVAMLLPTLAVSAATALTSAGGNLSAGEYVLNGDVELGSNLTVNVGNGNTVTIDLKGNILKGNGSGSVITVSSGTLVLNDSVPATEHAGYVDAAGLWHPGTGTGTSKKLTGGVITGGKGDYGGGICVENGTVNMNAVTVSGNEAQSTGGGGIFISNGNVTLNGCTVCNNKANMFGGGICINNGSLIIVDTVITDNRSQTASGVNANGGNVIFGGTTKITGNKIDETKMRNFNLAPAAKIGFGNGADVPAPTKDMKIGISTSSLPTAAFPVKLLANCTADAANYFVSDNDKYEVSFNKDHLELSVKHTHTLVPVNGQAATEKADGWKKYFKCECGKYFEDANAKVEITDLAKWKAKGGNGNIPKIQPQIQPVIPMTGDTSNIVLWTMLLALSSMAICASFVLGKRRRNER